jgi:hypothetical protein
MHGCNWSDAHPKVNEKVVLLNDAISKRRADWGGRNLVISITVGKKHDKDLLKLANKKHKIPQQFSDANWLAENPKMDVPSQIDDDILVQSCNPEICRDEDTLYEGGDEEDVEEQGHLSYPVLWTCFPIPIVTICSLCVSHFSRISLSSPMHRSNMVRCMDPIRCMYLVRSGPIRSTISFVNPFLFI